MTSFDMIPPITMTGKITSATSSAHWRTILPTPFRSWLAVRMLMREKVIVSSGTSTTPTRNVISRYARLMHERWPSGSPVASILSTM